MSTIARNPFFMTVFVIYLLFFTTGCQNTTPITPVALSGEEIFRGIFFFEGELVNKISYLKDAAEAINEVQEENHMSIESKNQLKSFQNNLLKYIKNKDHDFFENFRKGMTSGDPYSVKETIKLGTKEVSAYIKSLQDSDRLDNSKIAVEKVLQSKELKSYMSKSNLSKIERKDFISKALTQIQKEDKVSVNSDGGSPSTKEDPSTNCLAFEIVFVGAYFFILVAVFAYVSLVVAVDGLAIGTVLYEDWQFLDEGGLQDYNINWQSVPGDRSYQTKQDMSVNQLTLALSSVQ